MKILLVDDDPIARGVMSAAVTALGNEVTEADSGESAVAAIISAADDFGLVLMDMHMPGIGGQIASDRIRALPGRRGKVEIRAMSAAPMSPSAQASFDGFLPKGPDFSAMLSLAVSDAMRRSAPPPVQPPRSTLITWLQINLALAIALFSAVSFIFGASITATLRIGRFDDRLEALEAIKPNQIGPRIDTLEAHDRNRTDETKNRDDRRTDDRRADDDRFKALEQSLRWIGEHYPGPKR